jgi:hypothetical protein
MNQELPKRETTHWGTPYHDGENWFIYNQDERKWYRLSSIESLVTSDEKRSYE